MPRHSTKHDSAGSQVYSQYSSSQYLSDSSQSTSPSSSTSPSLNQSAQPSSHSGPKKKHVCSTCDRGFTTSGHLARHLRVHTGERNHKCPVPGCETRCSRQDNLQQQYVSLLFPFMLRFPLRSLLSYPFTWLDYPPLTLSTLDGVAGLASCFGQPC